MTITETAMAFFDACETGKGWAVCGQYCHDGASFSCQAEALADVTTLDAYTEWMKGMQTPVPDMRYEINSVAEDKDRQAIVAFATVFGTQTGEGGPVAPTGKKLASDYVYVMTFDGDKIRNVTKIWNDVFGLKQMGWA